MRRLFCFIGKPGCGKTTLLNELGVKYSDVLQYIQKYLTSKGGLVDEVDAILAYQEMFVDLQKNGGDLVFLELGTNYPEFVINKLKESNFDVTLFLCNLDKDICLERCSNRTRNFDKEQLIRRLNKPFPDEHLNSIKEHNLKFQHIDMGKDVEENAKFISIFLQ
tara:strand:- start:142 stop:633 length:492 start_codon:yes stop_codon:yes gene_type:complete